MITPDLIDRCLRYVAGTLERRGIDYRITYGTLLGAVRDGDVIAWDHDFDIQIGHERMFDVLALNDEIAADGFAFRPTRMPAQALAINPGNLSVFWNCALGIWFRGTKVGDIYVFFPFADGVLRRFDFENEAYWCPHSSFPAWFVEGSARVTLRGREYPTFRAPEKFLAGVYGEDWQTPYRAPMQGGQPRADTTTHGDRYLPKLRAEWQWCVQQGWDYSHYASCPRWPRRIAGAGPIGPTGRTQGTSNALWWRDVDELLTHF